MEARVVIEVEEEGRTLGATVTRAGGDLVVVVGGGHRPHVGCVVLAQPRPSTAREIRSSVTSSVINIPPHKEEPVARGIAELLARELGCVVVVTAGVHEDGLDRQGVESYLRLGERLGRVLAERLA